MEYDIALSFAGEDRTYVDQVANLLQQRGVRYFYDLHQEANLWGKDLYAYLTNIYQNQARFTVMFVSEHYAKKRWASHERQAIQARAFQEQGECILPAKFDNTEIPGLLPTIGYISLVGRSPENLVELICTKLILAGVHVKPMSASSGAKREEDSGKIEVGNTGVEVMNLQRERDKRDLELAAKIQQMLIPTDLLQESRMQTAADFLPNGQVGGDYYDVIRTGPDEYIICVADVSGHGFEAALFMSNFQAALRAILQHKQINLVQLVKDLNANVLERARGNRFLTIFIGRANLRAGTMEYLNAGHNPPMMLREEKVEELCEGSIGLGMLPELPFVTSGFVKLKDATLLCYTDGMEDQMDSQGNAFETGPIRTKLKQLADVGPRAINDALIESFKTHCGGVPYLDDILLLTCRFV